MERDNTEWREQPASAVTDPSFVGLVGVATRDMTPEPGIYFHMWGSSRHDTADSVHKSLYASAISFRANASSEPCVIATLDYCWFPHYQVVNALRRPILDELGIDPDRFLLVLSHSHSVPQVDEEFEGEPGGDKIPAFRAKVLRALREAVIEAVAKQTPAIVSWGHGSARLAWTRDFRHPTSGQILCGPNPAGVPDTTVLVGRVTHADTGAALATIVNYACHPVSLGGANRAISPDYIGTLREVVEAKTGGAPCLFLHGPSGNQTPRDSYAKETAVADANGEILGFAVLSVLRSLLPPGKRLEFADVESSGAHLAVWKTRSYTLDPTVAAAARRLRLPSKNWPTLEQIDREIGLARDRAALTRMTRLKQFVQNLSVAFADGFPVWAVRLGQAVVIATPAEAFVDLQIELRRRFPHIAIIVTNDTNGSFNYLPPASYFGNGAYEQDCSDFGPGSLEMIIVAAVGLIDSLFGSAPSGARGALPDRQSSYTWY